jgi:transcriptional regulator with XRE-family HTH domain
MKQEPETKVIDAIPPGMGELIRQHRVARRLSQGELAELVGVGQQLIGKIERGRIKTSAHLSAILAEVGLSNPVASNNPRRRMVKPPRYVSIDLPLYRTTVTPDGTIVMIREPIDMVARPDFLTNVPECYAILMPDASMDPVWKIGDELTINPNLPHMPNTGVLLSRKLDDDAGEEIMPCELVRFSITQWIVRRYGRDLMTNKVQEHEAAFSRIDWPVCHRVVIHITR